MQIAEKVDDVLRPGQQRDMTENDNAVEAVVYKSQQAAKQRYKRFHWSSPVGPVSATRSSDRRLVEIKGATRPEREERVQGKETAGFVPLLRQTAMTDSRVRNQRMLSVFKIS